MSISVNGHSTVPPGFRFHPTEEELLSYYLRKKVASEHIDLNVIRDIDLNKLEPWDIQEKCCVGTTAQNDWYFFSHKDKKYPTGTRTNRATAAGFWKATGRDKVIYASLRRIGMRKTLVFYMGRAPSCAEVCLDYACVSACCALCFCLLGIQCCAPLGLVIPLLPWESHMSRTPLPAQISTYACFRANSSLCIMRLKVFPLKSLQIFTEDELERVLCGEQGTWTFSELLDNVKFDHGCTPARLVALLS